MGQKAGGRHNREMGAIATFILGKNGVHQTKNPRSSQRVSKERGQGKLEGAGAKKLNVYQGERQCRGGGRTYTRALTRTLNLVRGGGGHGGGGVR